MALGPFKYLLYILHSINKKCDVKRHIINPQNAKKGKVGVSKQVLYQICHNKYSYMCPTLNDLTGSIRRHLLQINV